MIKKLMFPWNRKISFPNIIQTVSIIIQAKNIITQAASITTITITTTAQVKGIITQTKNTIITITIITTAQAVSRKREDGIGAA